MKLKASFSRLHCSKVWPCELQCCMPFWVTVKGRGGYSSLSLSPLPACCLGAYFTRHKGFRALFSVLFCPAVPCVCMHVCACACVLGYALCGRFLFFRFLVGGCLLYDAVLVSAVQRGSAISIYILSLLSLPSTPSDLILLFPWIQRLRGCKLRCHMLWTSLFFVFF